MQLCGGDDGRSPREFVAVSHILCIEALPSLPDAGKLFKRSRRAAALGSQHVAPAPPAPPDSLARPPRPRSLCFFFLLHLPTPHPISFNPLPLVIFLVLVRRVMFACVLCFFFSGNRGSRRGPRGRGAQPAVHGAAGGDEGGRCDRLLRRLPFDAGVRDDCGPLPSQVTATHCARWRPVHSGN